MVISTKHKFIFVHIPKNAGSSLTKALEEHIHETDKKHFSRSQETKHQSIQEIFSRKNQLNFFKKIRPKNAIEKYYIFAVVRNPFDRVVSLYHYLMKTKIRKEIDGINSFEDFVYNIKNKDSWVHSMHTLKPQFEYVVNNKGENIVDRICYFESLNEDLKKVESDLNITLNVPHKNESDHKSYLDYYKNSDLADIVFKHYEKDFEFFGYSKLVS